MTNEELLDAFESACEGNTLLPTKRGLQNVKRLRKEILRGMEVGKG